MNCRNFPFFLIGICLSFVGFAQSQPISFKCSTAVNAPPIIPDHGVSELISDFVMTCEGVLSPPAVAGELVTVRAYLNVNVTSRLLSTSPGLLEALLLVDDPAPGAQSPCPAPCTNPASGQYNVFQAKQIFGNAIEWTIPRQSWKTLRITNIRANVNLSGIFLGIPNNLVLFVIMEGMGVSNILAPPQQTVGLTQPGLKFLSTNAILLASPDHNIGGSPQTDFTISFTEGFPSAFKTRTISTQPGDESSSAAQSIAGKHYGTASGFYNPNFSGTYAGAGLATQGTRLIAQFNGIPHGAELLVSAQPSLTGAKVRVAMVNTGPGGEGPYSPIESRGFVPLSVNNGSAIAVWEIIAADASEIESVQFDVAVRFISDPVKKLPENGMVTVRGSLGPLSLVEVASFTDSSPRFERSFEESFAFLITTRGNPVVTGVFNAADFSAAPLAPLAPGSIAAVRGGLLTLVPRNAPQTQLPLSLGGTSVKINGFVVPIYATTPSQVNVQIPWELAGVSNAELIVTVDSLDSKPIQIRLSDVAPHIFVGANGSGFIARPVPVVAGSRIIIFCTGLGPVRSQPASGIAPLDFNSAVMGNVSVLIGGVAAAEVTFAGLVPGYVGIYQVNAIFPSDVPGSIYEVRIVVDGRGSNVVSLQR